MKTINDRIKDVAVRLTEAADSGNAHRHITHFRSVLAAIERDQFRLDMRDRDRANVRPKPRTRAQP